MIWIAIGATIAALGVGAGAFGAHVLQHKLSPYELGIFETAVRYQMYHVAGFMALGLTASHIDHFGLRLSGIFMTFGVLTFSGSLYLLVATGQKWLGAVAPIGGVALILAWLSLATTLTHMMILKA
ncbi:MAG: DUF423 domain-containing protein [Zetaproteobacteria bacterium]|nr:DUF423 domain-containing protein [Zetaproteobacteria bacterium]